MAFSSFDYITIFLKLLEIYSAYPIKQIFDLFLHLNLPFPVLIPGKLPLMGEESPWQRQVSMALESERGTCPYWKLERTPEIVPVVCPEW